MSFLFNRRVKIVSTVGPSVAKELENAYLAGVNMFRLNFSHGDHSMHQENFNKIRDLEKKHGKSLAILSDMQGPKLRVGIFKDGKVLLKNGQEFVLDMNNEAGDENRVQLPHPEIFSALKNDTILMVDDGKIRLKVKSFTKDKVITEVLVGGYISNNKGVNYPDVVIDIPSLTEKDKKDLEFALSLGTDYIALSFVQRPQDVADARAIIGDRAKIISKIEKPSAVNNIDEIIELSDGIMIARGDLGIEMPAETVPITQKRIIAACRQRAKPVIVATQMLESMISSPIPTRAEASDVANAVYDGADAIMLSGETAVGSYPVEAVKTMDSIIKNVEQDDHYWDLLEMNYPESDYMSLGLATSSSSSDLASRIDADYVIAFTHGGITVRRVSRERQKAYIIALTSTDQKRRQLSLFWGVNAFNFNKEPSLENIIDFVQSGGNIESGKLFKKGNIVVIVCGLPFGLNKTNTIHVVEVD